MTKPLLTFFGTVIDSKMVAPQNKKSYLALKIEGPPETYGTPPKQFRSRIEARVYYDHERVSQEALVGTMVSVYGSARAEGYDYQGKCCANLICERATVTVIPAPKPQTTTPRAAPAAAPAPRQTAPQQATADGQFKPENPENPEKPDDDDVPF